MEDPRFALTLIRHFYEIVVGRPALTVPEGAPSIERDGAFTAFEAQRAFLLDLAEAFVASNYDAKAVVRSLLLSPYYRARYESSRTEETDAARFDLGVAQLMTPEMFHRKIVAIFGDSFQSYPLWEDSLMAFNRYRTLYGGIDADTVTERLREPTGIMGGVQHLVANNVSCRQASREFDKAPEARRLLDLVELDIFLPAQEDAIRAQLVRLHERLLGERLAADHPAIDRSYTLFRRVRDEGAEEIAARRTSTRLGRTCEAGDITEDPDFVVRAWAAVMNYQMLTFEFLYQ